MALSLDTAKMQSNKALSKMLGMVDLTPETLAKTFQDVNASPEKLRALLNLWFTPRFKPSFVPATDYAVAGLRDVEFLATTDLPPGQLPYRMFDIETGNLVDFPAIGVRGQYCMLSHRWKGVELTLSYIKEARKKELERAREAVRDGKMNKSTGKRSDVQLVLEQCRFDIEEQETLIKELCVEHDSTETAAHTNVGELLDRRLKVRAAEDNFGWAKDQEDQAKSKLRFAQMERKIFSHLVGQMQDKVDEKLREHSGEANGPGRAATGQTPANDVGQEVVNEVQAEFNDAEANLKTAEAEYESVHNDIKYFQQRRHLRDALDELVCRLQRWKSAIKLDRSIRHADHIFKTKLFQQREKCYLWTDTCCIDKSNGGELSESLSLMGDWYADAEYTLVQLDTRFCEADAARDWHQFERERNGDHKAAETRPNIQGFNSIKNSKPEWSTRAWTLQELVMSKTTFYVNSEWTPLGRPVESLGYFYYLVPFISLYTSGDTRNIYNSSCATVQGFWNSASLKNVLDDSEALAELERFRGNIERHQPGSSETAPKGAPPYDEAHRVETAQQLITLLRALGVRIPPNLATETATSEMARAVYLASADLTSGKDKDPERHGLYLRLKKHLPKPDLTALPTSLGEQDAEEEVAQHTINFLLQSLVAETLQLILADRQYVAEFGQIQQLGAWQQGTSRTGFSAQSVLELSGKRKATVATDRSYALMGVLGVRFPTFSAEGYVKALARLLDEVVITRSDISVFNWTGMEMGSPIRGRSMYPSSHTAYGNLEDRGRRYNLLLSARVQDKMDDVVETYHSIIHTLRNAIDFLRDRERKNLPFGWIDRIIQLILSSGLPELKPQQMAFGKIIGYIKEHCKNEGHRMTQAKEAKMDDAVVSPTTTNKGFSLLQRPTMPCLQSVPSLPTSGFSLSSKKPSSAKTEESPEPTKKSSRFGLGKGVKPTSFGFSKKTTTGSAADKEPLVTEIPITPQRSEPSEVLPSPPPPYEEAGALPAKPSWHAIDREVMDYLSTPAAQRVEKTLPQNLQEIELVPQGDERPGTNSLRKHSFETQMHDTISPNPIIVNNSGIEGLFDIQRVIVTMIDPEKLRRQIAKAASPHDKISGWCSVSTGFARIITSFACERRILEQELDVIESVEARVLREQDKDKSERRGAQLLKTLSVTKAAAAEVVKGGLENLDHAAAGLEGGSDSAWRADQDEAAKDTETENTEEERLISRMIDFIQEPQLNLVAGEWVLARFSGASGANWFLCHLELGPVPGQFYGHRIAAGAIDFHDSTPEPGLVNAWQTYMDRKKRKMCHILSDYLQSRTMARDGEEKLKAGTGLARQGLDMAVKGLRSPGAEKSSTEPSPGAKEESGEQDAGQSGDESGDEGEESLLNKVLEQGKLAAMALGEYTVLAVAEKLFEMRADHLDKTLATAVLKRTPKSLRTAVENMNDNKSFLPAMFHSSTRMHMF